jgi:hypothetical protein
VPGNNGASGEDVFVLPKVFVIGGKAFGTIDLDSGSPLKLDYSIIKRAGLQNGWKVNILEEVPIWIYRSIRKFRKRASRTNITERTPIKSLISSSFDDSDATMLDMYISLRHFYEENRNLFTFVYKEAHRGMNKVKWQRTVSKYMPVIKGKTVVYPVMSNFKKTINYDEILLAIFFNTLLYVGEQFSERIVLNQPFHIEPYRKFRLEVQSGVILRKLLSIKNRYFNDKLVNLWNLLYLFYSNKKSVFSRKNFKEFVFVKKYNEVFEDMIDYLLGDSNKDPEIYSLKYQEDGKIVDHLFQGASIVTDRRNVYYVGDSKYYKDTTKLSGNSIFKQYTYARNIVQKQLDWFYGNAKDKGKYLNYRDEGTEGYNITPNFFITGIVSNGYFVHKDYLTNTKEDFPPAYQFPDRLFDRDTFFLQKYDINFLFVLYGYVAEIGFSRTAFKNGAQEHFKQDFTSYLNKKYIFNLLLVKDNITFDEAMNLHFRTLIGKIFRPFMDNDKLLILAQLRKSSDDSLDKNDNSGLDLLKKIHNEFLIYQYTLGTDIEKALNSGPIDDDVLYSPE